MYLELGTASLYVTVDGSTASWSGSIGGSKKGSFVSDREYSRYRASNPAVELLDSDAERVILKSARGMEEEWLRPHWVLTGMRKTRVEKKPAD
jgi:hypothetical protein